MCRNFYTTSSKEAFRNYAFGIILWIALSFAVSYSLFLYKPQFFYFRAWEYLLEGFPTNPDMPQVWEGFEKEDMSRSYFFRFQDAHYTRVTIDSDGWRAMPYTSDNYDVIIYGDSQSFGSGVSDNETFPWRLSIKLKLPIFNGSRTDTPEHLLKKPELQRAKLIVHVVQSASVSLPDYFPNDLEKKDYKPISRKAASISIRRFYLLSMLIHRMETAMKDLLNYFLTSEHQNDYLCGPIYRVSFSEGDLNKQATIISKYSQRLNKLGYTYVLVLVPHRCLLYSEIADEFSRQYFPMLIKRLGKEGVYAVDLQEAFLKNKHRGLFFHADTHWNARGIEVAVEDVAAYLKKKGLIRGFKTVKNNSNVSNAKQKT